MSNVIDSHNSLLSFKYKTKAFLLNKEISLSPLLCSYRNIRLITFSERLAHTEPLLLQLNILQILNQARIGLYKFLNGLHPQSTINNMYMYVKNSDVHNHNTRHKNYLHVLMAY